MSALQFYNAIVICKRDEALIPWHVTNTDKLNIPLERCLYYGLDMRGDLPTPPAGYNHHVIQAYDLYEHLPLKTYGFMKHALSIPGWTHLLKTDVNSFPTRIDLDVVATAHMTGYRATHRPDSSCVAYSMIQPALCEPFLGEFSDIWCGGPAYVVSRELACKVVERGIWYAAGWPAEDLMVSKVAAECGWIPQEGLGYWTAGHVYDNSLRRK